MTQISNESKTIFITSFHVLVSRNILQAPFLNMLVKNGWRVVLIMPKKKEEYFRKTFGGTKVFVEGVENKLARLDGWFKDLALAAIRTSSLRSMRARRMGIEHPLTQKFFFWAPLIRPFIPFLYRVFMKAHTFHDLFEKYNPSVVFSTDVFSSNDCRLLLEAKIHKVPTVAMVRSWDNLTTKGGFLAIPDALVVQNTIARDEAVRFHGISEDIIYPVGIPHYDSYVRVPKMTRAEFLAKEGIPLEKKYFVYAPLGDRIMKVGDIVHVHSYDSDIVHRIDRFLPPDCYLVVRFPPTDTVTIKREGLSERVRFSMPGVRFGEGVKGIRTSEMSAEDDEGLFHTLLYSNGIINPFSSLFIDAVFLDKPVIIPAFDPTPVSYWESVLRIQEFEHLRPVFQSSGVKVAKNLKELESYIRYYLEDESRDKLGRMELAEIECLSVDGHSSERLLKVIERFL